jgi:predicted TPR repeat methyltransferase
MERMTTPIFLSSGDVIADRRFEWARDRQSKGDLTGAADLMMQAIELVPAYAPAWFVLGEQRELRGDRSGAIAAFEQARIADPDEAPRSDFSASAVGPDARGRRDTFERYSTAMRRNSTMP